MLLRSSSTPILTSLIPSSSSHHHDHHHHQDHHQISCQFSSPISDANSDNSSSNLRRTRSVECLKKEYTPVRSKQEEIVEVDESNFDISNVPPLFLARGLGIDRLASGLLAVGGCDGDGNGGDCGGMKIGNGGDMSDLEMYYKQMVDENPDNSMILRNYAEFLAETKGDFRRAEEYYSRAIVADPGDGEILSQYAKLIWDQHRDEERADSYFQQSVQAAPDNSHVLAAYAGFLWDTEDDDKEDQAGSENMQMQDIRYNGAMASVSG